MSPDIIEIVRQAINESYGIQGSLSRLPGENLNYLVQTSEGQKFVAKIAGKEMPPEVIDMEYAALEHAKRTLLDLSFPGIIKNNYEKIETGIKFHNNDYKRLRILHYIEGDNLSNFTDISDKIRINLGQTMARFDQAMASFDHPSAHRKHRWDLARADQHESKLALVSDPEKHALLAWTFEQLTNQVSPVLPELSWQFIHGDPNPENIRIKNEKVVGLLDFGDSCFNPTVCDLAICLAYQMMDQVDPWKAAEQLICGYQSVKPLSGSEQSVLLPLVCGRLAVTICIATERRQIDANNANWFVSENPAWQLLDLVRSSGRVGFSGS